MQLLSILQRPNEYLQKYVTADFGGNGIALANLPRAAMPNDGITKLANAWNQRNMQNEAFDVTTYANRGTGTASAIGSRALVLRFKDGKSLANSTFSMANIDPTKPIDGVTDVYRFEGY